jgi:hypothetical protein
MTYERFAKEKKELLNVLENAIHSILLNENRVKKHAPYTWKDEDEAKTNFYWFKGAEQELDVDRLERLME